MSYVIRKAPRKNRGRSGLGADMVKVAEMSNMAKTSPAAAIPYATTSMSKSSPSAAIPYTTTTLTKVSAPSISDIFTPKPVPVLTVAPSMTDTYVAPKPVSAAIPYTTTTQWAKDSVVTTQPSIEARTPTPTVQPTYTPSPDYVAPTRSLAPTVQPTPTRLAPTRTLAPTVQPTYSSPDYVAPPVTSSDGPRYPVNVQPVSIIQPVLVPWADNNPGGRGGGGFKYADEIPQGLEPTPIVITRPFPWWIVAVGVGAYLYMKKK